MKKWGKYFSLLGVLLVGLSTFVYAGISVYAVEENDETYEDFEQELIDQYAADLQFIYERAAVVDQNGEIEQIDLSVLREQYGNNEFFDYLQSNFGPYQSRSNFGECMKSEFAKMIGLDIAKQVFSPEVKRLLASKAWKKASEVIVRTLGKKVGAKVLQKMIGKMVPGGIPAQIIFSAGKCGIKAVWK